MRRNDIAPKFPVTDMHMDLSTVGHVFGADVIRGYSKDKPLTLRANNGDVMQYVPNLDFPRMLRGGVEIATVNVCPYPYDPSLNDLTSPTNFAQEYQYHENIAKKIVETYPHQVGFASTAGELESLLSAQKVSFIKAIEGLHLDQNPKIGFTQLEYMLKNGLSVVGWMWNEPTPLGTPGNTKGEDTGLTDYGLDVLRTIDRPGMIIDISHSSDNTARDILTNTWNASVIATHAGARGVTNHKRNLPDDISKSVDLHGHVFVGSFNRTNADIPATVDDVATHIDYIRKLHGSVKRIALGPDFGGTHVRSRIEGLDNIATFQEPLYWALQKRDFFDQEIADIMGGNGKRFYRENLPQ